MQQARQNSNVLARKIVPQLAFFGTLGAQTATTYFAYHSDFLPNLLCSIVPAEYQEIARTVGTVAQAYAAWVGVGATVSGITQTAIDGRGKWTDLPKNVLSNLYSNTGVYSLTRGSIFSVLLAPPFSSAMASKNWSGAYFSRAISKYQFTEDATKAKVFAVSMLGAGVLTAQAGALYAALKYLPIDEFVAGIVTDEYRDAARLIAKIGVGVAAWVGAGIAANAVVCLHPSARPQSETKAFDLKAPNLLGAHQKKKAYLPTIADIAKKSSGIASLLQGDVVGAMLSVAVAPHFEPVMQISKNLNIVGLQSHSINKIPARI